MPKLTIDIIILLLYLNTSYIITTLIYFLLYLLIYLALSLNNLALTYYKASFISEIFFFSFIILIKSLILLLKDLIL